MKRTMLAALLLVACGGGNANTQPTPVALPSASATVAAPAPRGRGPSEALLAAFPQADTSNVAYADLRGLGRTKLFAGLIPGLLSIPGTLTPDQVTCARALAAGADEALVAAGGGEDAMVARFEKDTPSLKHCIVDVFGATGANVRDDGIVVVARNVAATQGAPAPLHDLVLHDDEYLVGRFKETDGTSGTATLTAADARFAVNLQVDLRDQRAAELIEQGLTLSPDAAKAMMPEASADEVAGLVRLMKALHVTRKASHLDVLFQLAEPPVDQARDLGMAASLAISGVRKYLLQSKKAEALNNIGAISKNMVEAWEREPLPPATRPTKLRSFPPVPKTVPRGVKYVSTPADWKPWDYLKFQMDQPQYYQYEVRAAPDGQSADIIARGDLNGDGKTSSFTLTVRVDKKTKGLVVAPAPVIVDGDE